MTDSTPNPAPLSLSVRRPGGVTFAAIVLFFASLVLLFFAATMAFGALILRHSPQMASPVVNAPPGTVPPSQAAITIMALFLAALLVALAAWGFATVVGLLRLKNWARISIIAIGALTAAFGLFWMIGALATPMLMQQTALPAGVSAAQLKLTFAAFALAAAAVALVGVGWIVYFVLPGARKAFAPPHTQPPAAFPIAPQPARSLHRGPITDFNVAQPVDPPLPAAPNPNDPEL